MQTRDWQAHLLGTKRYAGAVDGLWGKLTDAGTLLAMTDGPDTALSAADFAESARRLMVQAAAIRAFWSVEAANAGFQAGRPKILPERHRFSRNTAGFFDKAFPNLSNPVWDKKWYPIQQDARYDVLLQWCRILSAHDKPIDAAFASCSYGAPQIMGENAAVCGYESAPLFAEAMARDEQTQLRAFETFVTKRGILPALRKVTPDPKTWEPVAAPYNGTGFRLNNYHGRMASAFVSFGGK